MPSVKVDERRPSRDYKSKGRRTQAANPEASPNTAVPGATALRLYVWGNFLPRSGVFSLETEFVPRGRLIGEHAHQLTPRPRSFHCLDVVAPFTGAVVGSFGTDAHPSASTVYRQLRKRLPRVSLATVYRNLRRLAAEGCLLERAGMDGLRFDGNIERHDHFTCLTCRRVFDVPPAQALGPRRRVAIRTGFEVLDHRIEFYGVCAACRRRRRDRRAAAV